MKASIARLHKVMREVSGFLAFAGSMDRLRSSPANPALNIDHDVATYLASLAWRRHTYAFSIVSIYGAHERFVRDYFGEVAGALSAIYESYSRLPEVVRGYHERLTLDRSKDILDGRRGSAADFREFLSNLNACLDGSMSLNREVFSVSTTNYRSQVVREMMVSRLGVDLSPPDKDPKLEETVRTELNGFYSTISGVIDDLADRRNEIAHGSDYEILDRGTLGSILKAVYWYDCWLYAEVARWLLMTVVRERGVEIGSIAKTYASPDTGLRSIGSISEVSEIVRPNDVLYLLENTVTKVVVRTVEKNKLEQDLAAPGGGPYGLDFCVAVKKGSRVFRLPAKHSGLAMSLQLALEEKPGL